MDQPEANRTSAAPPAAGRFSWTKLALWLPAGVAAGLFVGWFAHDVETELKFTPWLLFPFLVGLGLGAILITVMRTGHVGHRPTVAAGTVLALAAAVVVQHYSTYRRNLPAITQSIERRNDKLTAAWAKLPDAAKSAFLEAAGEPARPPENLLEYLQYEAQQGRPMVGQWVARGWVAWLTWAVDALLVLAGAAAVLAPAVRLPYCNGCLKWYRTIRSRRIGTALAGRLAALSELDPPEKPVAARYRLSACPGGCGPTRMELSWETADGSTYLARTWLDAPTRNRVMQAADEPE